MFKNFKYLIFFILNIVLLFYRENLIKLLQLTIYNRKLLFYVISIIIFFSALTIYSVKNNKHYEYVYQRSVDKIYFIIGGNFFRNDNWYNVSKNTIKYNKMIMYTQIFHSAKLLKIIMNFKIFL